MLDYWVRSILIVAVSIILYTAPVAAASCESVASLKLPDGKITSAAFVAAGAFTPPTGGGLMMGGPGALAVFKAAPAFCRVTATLTPTPDSDIKIEVWMPAENWNGKLVGIGNGVWAGSISYSALAEPRQEVMQPWQRIRVMSEAVWMPDSQSATKRDSSILDIAQCMK
jgi:feruloyl esterase